MISDRVDCLIASKGTYENNVKQQVQKWKLYVANGLSNKDAAYNKNSPVHYDYTPYCVRRRTEGILTGVKEARERLAGIMPPKEMEAWFAFANCTIMKGGYNEGVDYLNAATLSAAIWILDELTLSGKIGELYQYLPADSDVNNSLDTFFMPLKHPMYDSVLVMSLVYLIRHRNTSKNMSNIESGSLLWGAEKPDNDEKSRKLRDAFDNVIALIRPESIEAAVQNYNEKVWDFYRISFSAIAAVDKCQKKIQDEIDKLDSSSGSAFDITSQKNVLLRQQTVRESFGDMIMSKEWQENSNKIRRLKNELDRLDDVTLTCFSIPNDREKLVKRLKGIIPKSVAEEILHFHVDDPFESSFALLYLLDRKSIIPWLYYGSLSVAYTFADQLPYDAIPDEPSMPVRISEWDDALYQHRYKGIRSLNQTDASGEPIERELAQNLSQLIFKNTLSLVPRVVPEQVNMNGFLDGMGELTEREKEAYSLLSYVLVSGQIRANSAGEYQALQLLEQYHEEDKKSAVCEEKITDEQVNDDQLISDNKRLRERNRELVAGLGSVLSEHKEDTKQLGLLRNRVSLQEKELSNLREAVFELKDPSEYGDDIETSVQYPYITEKKIVSFGGHQTWLKEMRRKLPEVIFVGPESLPNVDLIRNADAVWIQTNCLSHPDFFRIINEVKQYGIPLRYYSSAGVNKCAEQIVKSSEK